MRSNWYKSGRCLSAFSLIELLIVVAIIGILFSISIPSLKSFIARNRFYIVEQRLLHALAYTKALAIERDQTVMLCGSRDGKKCDGGWAGEWLVMMVKSQKVLHVFSSNPHQLKLTWQSNFKNRLGLYFDAFGETGGQQGRFVLQSGRQQVELIVIKSGRVRIHAVRS